MKPIVQKLPLTENSSFVSRSYRTPDFEVPWHHHVEYELILFTEGSGMSFIGNYIGGFETGDIFFLGKNLPHTFQKREKDLITSAIVIQFREDCWGEDFFLADECSPIRELFAISAKGLKVSNSSKIALTALIKELEHTVGFQRVIGLCNCLNIIASVTDYLLLSTGMVRQSDPKSNDKIDKIFDFTICSFKRPIELQEVASIGNMSVPAFCSYFKKCTKKTYISFLNEVRIGYACRSLANVDKSINQVCFESGFQTLQNFNKQFYKLKQVTPSAYRKKIIRNL
ncbi:helix-turn-helix domain-containing protein [Pedobacter petrophilus]|uniref:Helix-turn-helix domain-containing protein n=1 Tax=Pedobacter petrophilus TaxID=1908241 RepID=A0A7K0G0K8_9SPHI|nr:AraC family transcriptional regulator [Pedobacter petrophilus]MRX76960.1 helix-turn-helix domain-containing protein [Pedobacter petrophilus]